MIRKPDNQGRVRAWAILQIPSNTIALATVRLRIPDVVDAGLKEFGYCEPDGHGIRQWRWLPGARQRRQRLWNKAKKELGLAIVPVFVMERETE